MIDQSMRRPVAGPLITTAALTACGAQYHRVPSPARVVTGGVQPRRVNVRAHRAMRDARSVQLAVSTQAAVTGWLTRGSLGALGPPAGVVRKGFGKFQDAGAFLVCLEKVAFDGESIAGND